MKLFTKTLIVLAAVLSFQVFAQQPFTGKPRYQILTKRGGNPLGTIVVEMFPNIAPKHVRNWDSLVSTQFYDSCAFHRCIPNFMIQGGDPNSRSGPISTWGYGQASQPTVQAEFTAARHLRGRLSAARKPNPLVNSATSQFFICVATYPSLDGQYSVYGQVVSGMNWVDTIVMTPKMTSPPSYTNMPLQKIEMFITYVGSNDSVPDKPTLIAPANYTFGIDSAPNLQYKWNAINGGVIYQVQLSRDSTFQSDTVIFTETASLVYSKSGYRGNTKYFWRVRANNGGHFSLWSDTWVFHTSGETTGLTQQSAAEKTKVFPNPSHSTFTFSNLKPGAKIEVYDPSGKLILQDNTKTPEYILDLSGKARGTYILKLSDKDNEGSNFKLLLQ